MKDIVIASMIVLFTIQLSFVYADVKMSLYKNFTYEEILENRIQQTFQCNYLNPLNDTSDTSDSAISRFIQQRANNSGLLRLLLFQKDSFSRNTYNYCCNNLKGDIVFVNFGKYANVSVNLKNAVMYNEFLQISIPFGNWKYSEKAKQVTN
jgi:hypothetical protein